MSQSADLASDGIFSGEFSLLPPSMLPLAQIETLHHLAGRGDGCVDDNAYIDMTLIMVR